MTNIIKGVDDVQDAAGSSITGGGGGFTQEQIEDFVGAMFSGNTETFVAVTYQDADGTIDVVVPVLDEDDMASDSATDLATQQSIKAYVDTAIAGVSGATWSQSAIWDHGVSGDTAFPIQFTGLAGAKEIMVILDSVPASVAGGRWVQLSDDNGSSYYTTSGDYQDVSTNGVEGNTVTIFSNANSTTNAVSYCCIIRGTDIDGLTKFTIPGGAGVYQRKLVASTSPITAVQVQNSGGRNATGGTIEVWILS